MAVPSPTLTPTVILTPSAAADSSDLVNIADLALQISVGLVTVLALVLAVLAFFGVREIGVVRKTHKDVEDALRRAEDMRDELDRRLKDLERDLETMVVTAHLFQEGQTMYKAADYDRAISFYEDALRLQPDNNKIKVRLGRALVYKGQVAKAERLLRTAIEHDRTNADAWRAMSTCRRYANLAEAIECAEKAVELEQRAGGHWKYLGLLLRDDARYEDALGAYQEAEKLDPGDPVAPFYEGLVLVRLGRHDEGNRRLQEAFTKSELQRRTNRIKPIWALTIAWAYQRSLGGPGQQRSVEIAAELVDKCREARDREDVIGHMIFYTWAVGEDVMEDASLRHFSADDVHHVRSRMLPTTRPEESRTWET